MLLILIASSVDAKPLSIQVSAPSAILINAETGTILYEKNSHERRFPASITKIGTALYVLEKKGQQLNERAVASKHALHSVSDAIRFLPGSNHPPYQLIHDGTSFGLKVGERVALESLLYGLMLPSGNDAANVLAESVAGSIDRFCQEMDIFFKQHGILETHFVNPHGVHHPDHWTTAYDMAQMASLAMKHTVFREIVKSCKYLKPQTNLQDSQVFQQHNRLLKPGPFFYPKAIGIKTGYHSQAGFTLVGAATHEGRTLIAAILGCQESAHRYRDAMKLFDAAFSEKKVTRTLYARESDSFTYRIKGATDELKAVLKDDICLEYYPAEEPLFHAEIQWTIKSLPLAVGECVGCLRCVDEKGHLLIEKPIFAVNAISKTKWAHLGEFYRAHKPLCLAVFLGSQIVLLLIYFLKKHHKIVQ